MLKMRQLKRSPVTYPVLMGLGIFSWLVAFGCSIFFHVATTESSILEGGGIILGFGFIVAAKLLRGPVVRSGGGWRGRLNRMRAPYPAMMGLGFFYLATTLWLYGTLAIRHLPLHPSLINAEGILLGAWMIVWAKVLRRQGKI